MITSARRASLRRTGSALPILCSLWLGAAAFAQGEDRASESAAGAVPPPPPGVEEIQIIGERRDNSVQTEAIAVTSFDQSALDEFGVEDVESLQDFVPSLHVGRVGNQAVITIRGIGLENISITGKPSVVFEMDGVPLLRPSAALSAAFFDLENLQIVRGPQGTQGSYQTTAGKISLFATKPRPEFDMGGDFQYGTRSQKLVRAFVNLPVYGEALMTRLAVYSENRYGYQRGEYSLTQAQVDRLLSRPIYSTDLPSAPGDDFAVHPSIRARVLQSGPYDLRKRSAWGDDAKDLALRGQVLSLPNDNLELRTILTYSQQRGVGPNPVFVAGGESFPRCPGENNGDVCPPELLGTFAPGQSPRTVRATDPRVSVSNEQQFRDGTQYGLTFTGKWDTPFQVGPLGDAQLNLIGSYQKIRQAFLLDLDASNAAFTNVLSSSKATQRSIDLFVLGVGSEDFEWRAGLFFLQEDFDQNTNVDITFSSSASDVSNNNSGGLVSAGASVILNSESVTKNHSGYGELSYWLADTVKLITGLRYTTEALRASEFRSSLSDAPTHLFSSWSDLTPRAEILWQIADTSQLTFGATKGFKPGGFVLGAGAAGQIQQICGLNPTSDCASAVVSFDPETVYQYQITSKNQLFDESLKLDINLFWTAYDSYQSCQVRAEAFECVGGGKAQLRGVEVESTWTPYEIQGLAFNLNFNFLDTRIERFLIKDPTDPLNDKFFFRDIRGNRLPRSPLVKVALGTQYDFDLGHYGIVTPRFDFTWEDDTYFRTFNKGLDKQKAFYTLNLKGSWKSADGRYSIEGGVDNLTDVDIKNNVITGPLIAGSPVLAFYRPPRTWSIRFGWRWQ